MANKFYLRNFGYILFIYYYSDNVQVQQTPTTTNISIITVHYTALFCIMYLTGDKLVWK